MKFSTLSILRRVSNFRDTKKIKLDPKLNSVLEKEMCELGFVKFLCDLIIETKDPVPRFEYILALTDFLDEAHEIV